ncbi:MAG: hypothetical protein RL653_3782 [Pseudomonadota bacterium]|jgi:RND family efflux transporter MFP subunit
MISPRSLATLTAGVLAVTGCKHQDKAPEAGATKQVELALPPVKVETAPVELLRMPRYATFTGSVTAHRQSEVAANVSGQVTQVLVERGMPVRKGQVLAVVDSRAAGFQVAAAEAQSQAARTQSQMAKQDCERADLLFTQGSLAKSEYERMMTACTAQLYQANAAAANAALAHKVAGDTQIRAPFDGIIGERFVNLGEYVQPPSRVASVYAVDPVRVNLSVPEQAVGLVRAGQSLQLGVSAWPGRQFPAVVRFVSPALRANTRDLIVEAWASNPDGALRPGMFAVARVSVGEEEQPTVPSAAIRADGTVKRMYLARDGQAFEMVVRTGVEQDGRVAVMEPLTAGDKVIVSPPPGLKDGASIQ